MTQRTRRFCVHGRRSTTVVESGLPEWNGTASDRYSIFSLPVASANSLHSLSKARVRALSSRRATRDCEIVITERKLRRC